MKKTITKQVEQTVHICDVCAKTELGSSPRSCWLCQREACYQCLYFLFSGKSGDLVDFGVNICTDCRKHTELVEKVQSILDGANAELREWIDLWQKASLKTSEPTA